MNGHEGVVHSVNFIRGGAEVVSGGDDKVVRIWDVQSQTQTGLPLKGHSRAVKSIARNGDGNQLVSGSADESLWIWDMQTRQPIGKPILGQGGGWVKSVAYSPDGAKLAVAYDYNNVVVWPGPKVWPDLLCAKLSLNMTRKEWREHVSTDIEYIPQCPDLPIPSDEPEQQSPSNGD
jgi:WD40 repeat protein